MISRLIISPSGNYYGSEQVLHDYLSMTSVPSDVLVPKKGIFFDILRVMRGSHRILQYQNIYLLYIWVAYKLFTKKYKTVYINEAGHVKYIHLLSTIFKNVKFVIHVRILEDTVESRWPKQINPNITIVTISRFIKDSLRVNSTLLYDIYKFDNHAVASINILPSEPLRIAIIGRVTQSKGLHHLQSVLQYVESKNLQDDFTFMLFGDLSTSTDDIILIDKLRRSKNVLFIGFENDKVALYEKTDCVFHCSIQEPLGRIFIESINYLKPFVGFNKAGIGEIGELVGLDHQLIDFDAPLFIEHIVSDFSFIKRNYAEHMNVIVQAKNKAKNVFSAEHYTSVMDSI